MHTHGPCSLFAGLLRLFDLCTLGICFRPALAAFPMLRCVHTVALPLSHMPLVRGGAVQCCMQAAGVGLLELFDANRPQQARLAAGRSALKGYGWAHVGLTAVGMSGHGFRINKESLLSG